MADLTKESHLGVLEELQIDAFDLVVVNLYPFSETVNGGAGLDETIEQIDIGGPALIRAAAKNYKNVTTLVSPKQYSEFIGGQRATSVCTKTVIIGRYAPFRCAISWLCTKKDTVFRI